MHGAAFVPVPMNKAHAGLSAPGATVSVFVDWCGAEEPLRSFATKAVHRPLVIAGGIKSGKSILLNHVLPGAIKAAHLSDRFLVLPVYWSRLKDARDFPTVFHGFQCGIIDELCVARIAPPA